MRNTEEMMQQWCAAQDSLYEVYELCEVYEVYEGLFALPDVEVHHT